MFKKRYTYILLNILVALTILWNWKELYNLNNGIKEKVLIVVIIFIISNFFLLILNILYNSFFSWYDKKTKEKYNFYEWIGKPDSPIKLYETYSNKKDFNSHEFEENCELIKDKIKQDLPSLKSLKSYKNFLELQIDSPRLNALMNTSQTITLAIITASLITLLNFLDADIWNLIISYFAFFLFLIGLFKAIDFLSTEMDRNKLLLLLVKECIEEHGNGE